MVIQHLWNTCPIFRQLLRMYALDSCSKICSLDFVLIRYGKVTDMKTAAFEKRIYYLQFSNRRKHIMPWRATWRVIRFGGESETGVRRRIWPSTFIVFSMGKARQGKKNSLGLVSLNNFSVLLAIGVISSCLVSGSG